MNLKWIVVVLSLMLVFTGYSQKRKFSANGSLPVKNYPPKETGGNPQIFAITQDYRGVMYFANQVGVLEFDGSEWRKIEIEGRGEVNYVGADPNGIIHVGGQDAYGKLVPDKTGMLHYTSLRDEFPDSLRDKIGLVKRISISNGQKIIQTESCIYLFIEDSLHIIRADTKFMNFFEIDDDRFIVQKDLGLYKIANNRIVPAKDGYQFSVTDNDIVYLTKFNGRTIIVTSENGLYEIDEFDQVHHTGMLEGVSLFSAININNEYLSMGTISDGVRILDKDLNLVYSVGLDKGLIDPQIKTQFYDREQNLWLATNKGVSKIELITPILVFDKKSGIRSTVQALEKFNNTIYAAALDGVYYFNEDGDIHSIPEITTDCYGLNDVLVNGKNQLFVAELERVYKVNGKNDVEIVCEGGPYDFQINPKNPQEIIVLHYDGISNLIFNEDGSYQMGRYIRNFSSGEQIFNFIIRDDGTILIGSEPTDGIYVTHVDIFHDSTVTIENWNSEKNGLPKAACYLMYYENTLFVATDSGLYYQDGDQFHKSDHFGVDFNKIRMGVHRISKDKEGKVWMILFDEDNNYEIGYAEKVNGKFVWKSYEFMRYATEVVHGIFHDDNQITWLGGPNGLIRYDGKIKKQGRSSYRTLIRQVKYGSVPIFMGSVGLNAELPGARLDYSDHRSLSFTFSATSFIDEENNEYSYKLEGYDEVWSDWSKLTIKEYNLTEGSYIFKVKARNIYGDESEVAEFRFSISPPWYRTTWAYITYVVLLIILIYLVIRFSVRRIKKQNQRLEQLVRDRTFELVAQKEEVEKQKEIVEEKNRDIMDSIRYAKHIQDAILPSDEFVSECFTDAFILYRPKDIVSGDFYWVKQKGNKILFAAVDCTGHGVPGAFVSIVGNNGLNRAINEFNLIRPGEILDKLTELVLESFKQPGSNDDEVKDGMDIALCSLDMDTMILEYAGANNSLYLVREGEMTEIKADKQPIGAFENRKPFTTHSTRVQPNDRIFLFTDGFADQFGGPKGKKLKYKTFKSLLLENNNRPISEYRMILSHAFNQWKGPFEQIDDVCVIGITI